LTQKGTIKLMGKDIATVLFLLLIIIILWYAQGGQYQIGPPPAQTSPHTSGATSTNALSKTPASRLAVYRNIFISHTGARRSTPQEESIEIRYLSSLSNQAIRITGWKLQNKNGDEFVIGTGAKKAFSARENPQSPIILQPGQGALVITGDSPISTNFLINKCMGYFTQFRDFGNVITKQCPHPRNESEIEDLDQRCINYIQRLPQCFMPLSGLSELTNTCQEYVSQNINYAQCVQKHEQDENFYQNKWVIYLERSQEIWKNTHDTITLKDTNDNIVTEISY